MYCFGTKRGPRGGERNNRLNISRDEMRRQGDPIQRIGSIFPWTGKKLEEPRKVRRNTCRSCKTGQSG